jgi:hypothetical protein
MKKLLIAGLVLAMLVVFSGVANAQYSWWESGQIQSPITLTYQKFSKGNTTLGTISGKFTGYMVASSNTATQGAIIEEVFMCGTLTVAAVGETLDVWLDFSGPAAFSYIGTDHAAEPSGEKTDNETADVIAIGTFHDQSDDETGPVYLNGKITLKEDSTDNIESITVKGTVAGGYAQGSADTHTFSSPSVSAVLAPYTGAIPLTCVKGVVVPLS